MSPPRQSRVSSREPNAKHHWCTKRTTLSKAAEAGAESRKENGRRAEGKEKKDNHQELWRGQEDSRKKKRKQVGGRRLSAQKGRARLRLERLECNKAFN